jgi:transposase
LLFVIPWLRGFTEQEALMRGEDRDSGALFSYVSCEARVPADHPLRAIRAVVDEALEVLSPEFERLYSKVGRPSIAPEKLLRALLVQAFYSVRSERQLMEQLDYNLLFRWFVGLSMDAPVWDATVFSKNRDRLIEGEIAAKFLAAVLSQARVKALLSDEHFSVDGTLIDAWASMKSFRPKDGSDDDGTPPAGRNAERDFRGQKRSNETHASTTDPDAKLYRKGNGQSSRLCFMGHLLMEHRNALIVDATLSRASGTAEREAALAMLERRPRRGRRITLAADKAYDVRAFVEDLRERAVTPHIAIDGNVRVTGRPRSTAIDKRTTRHPGYAVSQRIRKRIEEGFGWIKTTGNLAKTRHRGLQRVGWAFTLTAAAYNLVRIPKLLAPA